LEIWWVIATQPGPVRDWFTESCSVFTAPCAPAFEHFWQPHPQTAIFGGTGQGEQPRELELLEELLDELEELLDELEELLDEPDELLEELDELLEELDEWLEELDEWLEELDEWLEEPDEWLEELLEEPDKLEGPLEELGEPLGGPDELEPLELPEDPGLSGKAKLSAAPANMAKAASSSADGSAAIF